MGFEGGCTVQGIWHPCVVNRQAAKMQFEDGTIQRIADCVVQISATDMRQKPQPNKAGIIFVKLMKTGEEYTALDGEIEFDGASWKFPCVSKGAPRG